MAWRFRRSIKIAPGIRINLNKKSTSVRIGPRGLGYTISSTGKRTASVGIPGTGLSYSETVTKKRKPSEPIPIQNFADIDPVQEFVEHKSSNTAFQVAAWMIGIAMTIVVVTTIFSSQRETVPVASVVNKPSESQPLAAQAAEVKLITKVNLRLRAEPTISAKAILTIPAGTQLIPTDRVSGWSKVVFNGKLGWVSDTFLSAD